MWKVLALLGVILVAGCGEEETPAEAYPGPWRNEPKIEVLKLIAKQAEGGDCNEAWWRERAQETVQFAEYLVYCRQPGKGWIAWIVWPSLKRINGPIDTFQGVPPPY